MLNYKIYLNKFSDKYILLLHCICGDMTIFNIQLEELKKNYNVILIDLPYHGKSKNYEKDLTFFNISNDIISILNNNNIKKVTVIGLSLGSCIANYLCYYFKDRIEKVVFVSPANGLSNKILNHMFFVFTKINIFLPINIYLRFLIFSIIPQADNKYFRNIFYHNGKDMQKNNLRNWLKLLSKHFYNYQKYLADYSNNNKIPKVYLIGENDYIFMKSTKKNVINNKYSKLTLLPKKSHMLDIDKNSSFSKLCIQHLNEFDKIT